MAEAQYVRFWRGEMRPDISYSSFQIGLNEIFVPFVSKLKFSQAKLQSYHPFLFSPKSGSEFKLPTEIAIVEFESQHSYELFKESDLGVEYARLHWNIFDKNKSKSLIAKPYSGQIQTEAAYIFNSAENLELSRMPVVFKTYLKLKHINTRVWTDQIKTHIERLKSAGAAAVVFLVANEYLLEYSFEHNGKDILDPGFESVADLAISHQVKMGSELEPDSGLKF